MPYAAILVFALALSLVGTLLNLSPRVALAAPARPNIVMFYIDDFSPYPARLWNNTERTPELAKFANHGIGFTDAHASTPLCGPARANLLTGMYGHNSGVTQNRMSAYTGRRTIATRLRTKGYRTAFAGKHINGLARTYPTRSRMAQLSKRWDQFDVIWQNQGRFYDWRQYRKDVTRPYGYKATDHSSYQAAMRAIRAIRTTPKGKPLFLVVSLYDGHPPLTPMRRFQNHPKCRSVAGWQGPAYNENNVSDKPAYIRARPKRTEKTYDL